MTRARLAGLALLLALCAAGLALPARSQSLVGARAVTAVSHAEVRQALAEAGVTAITDNTADPSFPSFAGAHSQGIALQATLYACDAEAERCRGVELHSVIPATTLRNAEIIVASVERSVFGIDAQVFELPDSAGRVAVMLSSYLVYDYGVSERLLAIALEQFHSVIGQTKSFMLKDDPAHAELWSRRD